MSENNELNATVYGGPTKRLFVSMLTRDIALTDALLDLLDNCIDGAMRQRRDRLESENPYDGCWARMKFSEDSFELVDNCGGIPREYIDDAFSLGRPNIQQDGDLPTIGMYGIGMKRAIFKMGKSASVESRSTDGAFKVDYSADWLNPENNEWNLPIEELELNENPHGVRISITDIKSDILKYFTNEDFVNSLQNTLSEHFGYLMQKGFQLFINEELLEPKTLPLHSTGNEEREGIQPYDFEGVVNGVQIKVTVGLHRNLAKETEIDKELFGPSEKENAGVSVICNDRVILLSDRTMKTGWGDGGVPRYHSQFRSIAGLIVLTSNNADLLPLSTTKNDLDSGSDVFLSARKFCMEGLKTFTDFTNKWKGMEEDTKQFFQATSKTDARKNVTLAKNSGTSVRSLDGAKKFSPNLPKPANKNPKRRVSFVRTVDQIDAVSLELFGEKGQEPSVVGGECFDQVLSKVQK